MLKRIMAGLSLTGMFMLSGCFGIGGDDSSLTPNPVRSYDYSQMKLVQLDQPEEGKPIATLETTVGTITAVLYPEYAPNTVQNFIDRAQEGFYDGKDIYGIFEQGFFMCGAADDAKNTGVTGDGELIANEYSVNLWPFKGAFCSYNGHTGFGDSRFFVINGRELTEQDITDLREFKNDNDEKLLPDELVEAFIEKGCIAGYSGRFTVFAQTIDGMDVVEKICSSEVSGDIAAPITPIYINKITIGEYHAE